MAYVVVYCRQLGARGVGDLIKTGESAETYLETILILSKAKSRVRSIDIANELEYSKPSVSVAMKNLREGGHITVDVDGHIALTESGREIAESMYERHRVISDFLISLGVEEKAAITDACRIEHVISEHSFTKLSEHFKQLKQSSAITGNKL